MSFAQLRQIRFNYPDLTHLDEFIEVIDEHEKLWGLGYNNQPREIAEIGRQMLQQITQIVESNVSRHI